MSKRGFSKMSGGLFAVLSFALLLSLSLSCIAHAYEKEIVLGEVYQTEKEKETLKDRFRLDLSLSYGYSYAQILTGLYGLDRKFATYLNRLDMDYLNDLYAVRLTATYAISNKIGMYLAVPFGAGSLKKAEEALDGDDTLARFFEEDKIGVGIGDIYGGIYFNLLSGTRNRPDIVVYGDVNSDVAKHYPLGDGFWDITAGMQIRQLISDSFYIFGMGDYTHRLKKKNVEPGGIVGYGGGIGFLSSSSAFEIGLKAAKIDETKIDNKVFFEKDEDLALSIALKSLYKGMGMSFNISNLDEGFNLKKNTFGFEINFPIL